MRLASLLLLLAVALPAAAAEPEITPLYQPAMVLRTSNFRADPSTDKPPLDTFQAGTQVLIVGETEDAKGRTWYAVSLYDGTRGFIFGNLLAPLPDFPRPPSGLGTTTVEDEEAAQQLVGNHGLTLQWIGEQPWGEFVVFEDLGLYYAQGGQTGEGEAARETLSVKGFITQIDAKGFTLRGTIDYTLYDKDKPITCTRSGSHRFERIAKSNTWRSRAKAKPCGDWEDVVEVYLRKE